MKPLLVIGCGNELAGNDAVGLAIVEILARTRPGAGEYRTMPFVTLSLLDLFREAETVVFVDACSSGGPAGRVALAPLPASGVTPRGLAPRDGWSLADAIALSATLRYRVPRLVLIGVESDGGGMTAEVARAATYVVEHFEMLRDWALALDGDEAPVFIDPFRKAGREELVHA